MPAIQIFADYRRSVTIRELRDLLKINFMAATRTYVMFMWPIELTGMYRDWANYHPALPPS